MLRLAVAIVLAISGWAQGMSGVPKDILAATRSPFELAKYIDSHTRIDWEPIWQALANEKAPEILPSCGAPPLSPSCSEELIAIPEPSQVILLLQSDPPGNDFYLRFFEQRSGWRFAGYYFAYVRYHPRRHEIMRFSGKPFLKISVQGAHGSDVDGEFEEWLDLSRPGFEPVFCFPVQGYYNQWYSDTGTSPQFIVTRRVQGFASPGSEGAVESIHLGLSTRFSVRLAVDREVDLGETEFSGVYERSSANSPFSLRRAEGFRNSSTISNKEFALMAEVDSDIPIERILVYVLPSLKGIAAGKDADAKKWLQAVLEHCKETPEKTTLEALLRSKR